MEKTFESVHGSLTDEEFEQAAAFYSSVREKDSWLQKIEDQAVEMIFQWTLCSAIDVGSFGLKLNLASSDLDLAIGVDASQRSKKIDVLKSYCKYKGERRTSKLSTRDVFVFELQGVEIDVGVLPIEDFQILQNGLSRYDREMSQSDRVIHTWRKKQLKEAGAVEEYARLKLYPYETFCPSFDWVPIL